MIKNQDILKVVKLVLLSGYLKDTKPLSLLIIGKAGNGKTENIKYHKSKTAVFMTDLSYRGVLNELKNNPDLKHFIIPDFLKITMKRRSTSDNLISLLNALTEDGVGKISMYNYDEDFKDRIAGVIIATTKASYEQQKKQWDSIGFTSRMLLCSYDYSNETIEAVLHYINSEQYKRDTNYERIAKYRRQEIPATLELNKQLNECANKKFRTLKQLQTLAKCNALLRGSKNVEQQDIDEIKRLSQYLNLKYTKL